jgi:hypothetical protein
MNPKYPKRLPSSWSDSMPTDFGPIIGLRFLQISKKSLFNMYVSLYWGVINILVHTVIMIEMEPSWGQGLSWTIFLILDEQQILIPKQRFGVYNLQIYFIRLKMCIYFEYFKILSRFWHSYLQWPRKMRSRHAYFTTDLRRNMAWLWPKSIIHQDTVIQFSFINLLKISCIDSAHYLASLDPKESQYEIDCIVTILNHFPTC